MSDSLDALGFLSSSSSTPAQIHLALPHGGINHRVPSSSRAVHVACAMPPPTPHLPSPASPNPDPSPHYPTPKKKEWLVISMVKFNPSHLNMHRQGLVGDESVIHHASAAAVACCIAAACVCAWRVRA